MTRPRTGFPYLDAGLEQPGAVLAFAHRGGAFHPELEGLENTMTAFEHAVGLGYRYLETDVHATRDGVLLAFHDAVLDRVTSHTGPLAETRYVDLAGVVVGDREQIPTLASLLERFPETCFNIDIKATSAVEPLAALVRRTGAHDRVCVGSFSERRMRAFRRAMDRPVATAHGPATVVAARFGPTPVAARAARGSGRAFQVPPRRGAVRVVTEEFVARAHAAGQPVHVWTIDDPAEMHALLDLGVDGLMTDRTDLLRDVLIERGQWMGAP
ncbi:MAG TPA: glycerophosphodiester phosphodiesterase [Nocardioides sp.]|nr:glycerophosphodiester phosphodiesterase [Nocardioides sp.]